MFYSLFFADLALPDVSGTRMVGLNKSGSGCPPPPFAAAKGARHSFSEGGQSSAAASAGKPNHASVEPPPIQDLS